MKDCLDSESMHKNLLMVIGRKGLDKFKIIYVNSCEIVSGSLLFHAPR